MQTIALISQKGGSGKTTTAVHLAVCAERDHQRVAVIDLDPQGSSVEWARRRRGETPEVISARPEDLERLLRKAESNGCDLMIVDTAPHSDRAALMVAKLADLILIPCRPAVFDVTAIETTLAILRLAESAEKARVVLNAVPTRGGFADDADAGLSRKIQVCPVRLYHRAAYTNAINSGHSVVEFDPRGKASSEIKELWDWVFTILSPSYLIV